VEVATTLRGALDGADAVMTLRVQLERDAGADIDSVAAYAREWGITPERLAWAGPEAVLLHPGPTNEGVEVSAAVAGGPRSLIGRQVENGVPVRMAVLALVCGAAA
jgi:aspartate carbamoyltransferase catalytic subunit